MDRRAFFRAFAAVPAAQATGVSLSHDHTVLAQDLARTMVQPYCPKCGAAVMFPVGSYGGKVGQLYQVVCGLCGWTGLAPTTERISL